MDTKISHRMNRPLAEVDPEIADALREEGRRRLSRKTLLRRLRIRGPRRAAGDRPREDAVWRRPRQRAITFWNPSERFRLYGGAAAGRHGAGDESGARRTPDARAPAQFFRENV